MSHALSARSQMGTSLAFHIVFAAMGVGLPVMMLIAEGYWLRTGDKPARALAKTWSKAAGILFAIGAVSGTVLSFELGLLWPGFMRHAGGIIGVPFSLEGFAFFIEAIFAGIYIFGWERLSPRLHFAAGFPVAIAGLASAFFVVTANSWMNFPAGFRWVNGHAVDIDPLAAMFNPGWPTQTSHMMLGAVLATSFGIAAVYSVGMLRGRRDAYHRRALTIALAVGAIAAPLTVGVGDLLGRTVAQHQPAKLAIMEGHFETSDKVGINIVGLPVPGEFDTVLNVKLPYLLSLLAKDSPDATVEGLDAIPAADRPTPANFAWVRLSFLVMVAIGTGLIVLGLWFWLARKLLRRIPEDRITLRALTIAGPLAFLAIEAGWMVTEIGRQPWIIYGVLRTEDAVTPSPGLGWVFGGFSLLYILLAIATAWLLRRMARGAPPELREGPGQPPPVVAGAE